MNGINHFFIKSDLQKSPKEPLGNTTMLHYKYSTAIFLLFFSPELLIKLIKTFSHYFLYVTYTN